MYGKVFEDLFCSTLMDCGGDTAYVFIAMIVLSDEQGYIKHTENSLARLICKPVEIVREAIKNLEAADPESNIKAYDGRRIVPLHELMDDETRGWLVVNKEVYRDRASKEDKRKADRERIAEKRLKNKGVADSRKESRSVADVAHTDTDTDTDTKREEKPQRSRGSRLPADWKPSEVLKAFASKERPDLDLKATVEKFKDYWSAVPGQRGTKLDWEATFRNWVRSERQIAAASKPADVDKLIRQLEEEERQRAAH